MVERVESDDHCSTETGASNLPGLTRLYRGSICCQNRLVKRSNPMQNWLIIYFEMQRVILIVTQICVTRIDSLTPSRSSRENIYKKILIYPSPELQSSSNLTTNDVWCILDVFGHMAVLMTNKEIYSRFSTAFEMFDSEFSFRKSCFRITKLQNSEAFAWKNISSD